MLLLCVCLAVLAGLRAGQPAAHASQDRAGEGKGVRGAPMGGAWADETGTGRLRGVGGPRRAVVSWGEAGLAKSGLAKARGGGAVAGSDAAGEAGRQAPAARGMGDRWWDFLPPPSSPAETARPL